MACLIKQETWRVDRVVGRRGKDGHIITIMHGTYDHIVRRSSAHKNGRARFVKRNHPRESLLCIPARNGAITMSFRLGRKNN